MSAPVSGASDATFLNFNDTIATVPCSFMLSRTRLPTMADLDAKANKSEMAITAVSGDATKKNVQLKSGTAQDVVVEHQQLTPVYGGNGEKAVLQGLPQGAEVADDYPIWGEGLGWELKFTDLISGKEYYGISITDSLPTTVTCYDNSDLEGTSIDVTIVSLNPIIGYTLGSQSTKPLQPKGDYQPALGFTPENVANKVTSITSESTDTQYPSAKAVHDGLSVMLTRQEAADGYTSWQGVPAGYVVEWHGYDIWDLVRTSDSTTVATAYADYNETTLTFDKPGAPGEYINVTRELLRPAKTSQLTNDGNGSSAFALLSQLYAAVRNLAPDFTAKSYVLNELCTYNGVFYRCKSAYTATSSSAKPDTDTTHWEAKKASEIFLSLTGGTMTGDITVVPGTSGSVKDAITIVTTSGGKYGALECVEGGVSSFREIIQCAQGNSPSYAKPSDIGIPAFSTAKAYALGAKVIYDNALWNCTTAVATAGVWDSTKWAKVCNLAADATPTANSVNLMTSGAIKTALDSIKAFEHDESGYYIEV